MKKSLFLMLSFCIILISSCTTTPPVEKQKIDFTKQISGTEKHKDSLQPQIKIYFPSFKVYGQNRIAYGDGILIFLPDGKVMMIDSFDSEASDQLVDFLDEFGIIRIDYFIATHNHADHIGGVPALIQNFAIKNYYWNGAHFDSENDEEATQALKADKIQPKVLKQGDTLILCEEPLCKIEVLWPNLSVRDNYIAFYKPGRTAQFKNNTSIVLKLTYGDFTALFTGDIYKNADEVLTRTYGSELKSTILKVPHHGEFYTANNPAFVEAVSPEVAIIQDTCYVSMPYSNYKITKIYNKINSKLLFRNKAGYILVTSNGSEYSVKEKTFKKHSKQN